jgi:hypothetical protein
VIGNRYSRKHLKEKEDRSWRNFYQILWISRNLQAGKGGTQREKVGDLRNPAPHFFWPLLGREVART